MKKLKVSVSPDFCADSFTLESFAESACHLTKADLKLLKPMGLFHTAQQVRIATIPYSKFSPKLTPENRKILLEGQEKKVFDEDSIDAAVFEFLIQYNLEKLGLPYSDCPTVKGVLNVWADRDTISSSGRQALIAYATNEHDPTLAYTNMALDSNHLTVHDSVDTPEVNDAAFKLADAVVQEMYEANKHLNDRDTIAKFQSLSCQKLMAFVAGKLHKRTYKLCS